MSAVKSGRIILMHGARIAVVNRSSMTTVKPGDRARLIKLPDGIADRDMRELFEQCLGKVFLVGDTHDTLVDLEIGKLFGRRSYMESIYVEHECIEVVTHEH